MRNPRLCKKMLERILNIEIDHIDFPDIQKTLDFDFDAKSVRLDVYVKDEKGTVFNVEMQALNKDDLRKRSRYYQAMIDLDQMEKGADYENLAQSYIIFICDFDLFGENRYIYTFENRCLEDYELRLMDGTTKIFLNAKGSVGDISKELKAFLEYVGKGIVGEDEFVKELNSEVTIAKKNHKWRWEYMKLFLLQQDAKREGRREGRQEGRQEGRREGRQEGRREGEMVKVISLTRKKMAKSLSVDEIAEVLEEDTKLIRIIAEALEKEPQKSDADIYELIHQEKEGTV
ncbi:MAG: Rpn family recombination-promoting nuclease/putative transposase [Blautia sp.]|nr:Rpn family recombination-promoting nuclease/putative transposase [Blautia sp.]